MNGHSFEGVRVHLDVAFASQRGECERFVIRRNFLQALGMVIVPNIFEHGCRELHANDVYSNQERRTTLALQRMEEQSSCLVSLASYVFVSRTRTKASISTTFPWCHLAKMDPIA